MKFAIKVFCVGGAIQIFSACQRINEENILSLSLDSKHSLQFFLSLALFFLFIAAVNLFEIQLFKFYRIQYNHLRPTLCTNTPRSH